MGIYSDYKKEENSRLEPKRKLLRHIIMMDFQKTDDEIFWDLMAKAERWDSTEQDFDNLYKYMDTLK